MARARATGARGERPSGALVSSISAPPLPPRRLVEPVGKYAGRRSSRRIFKAYSSPITAPLILGSSARVKPARGTRISGATSAGGAFHTMGNSSMGSTTRWPTMRMVK